MRQRKLEELELSNLLEDCDLAIVHGVVTELSPIKKSAHEKFKYFQAQLSNGTKSINPLGAMLIGASLSKPHTSELNGGFFIYY